MAPTPELTPAEHRERALEEMAAAGTYAYGSPARLARLAEATVHAILGMAPEPPIQVAAPVPPRARTRKSPAKDA